MPRLNTNITGHDLLRLAEQASGQPAKKKQGSKYQLPCPLRDHAMPGGFVVFLDTGVGYCVKCGQKASQVAMFAGWLRQSESSTREWLRRQRDPAHTPTSSLCQPIARPSTSTSPQPTHATSLTPRALSAVYSRLLQLLPLSPEHGVFESKRGQTAERMHALGYGTLPDGYRRSDHRAVVTSQLLAEFGAEVLAQVPGCYVDQRGGYWTLYGRAGRLIPMRGADGHISRLMLNPDKHRPDEGKYRYLATPGREAEGAAHIAIPEQIKDKRIYITEGPRKADIAAARLGATVVGCMGVSGRSHAYTELLAYCGNQRPTVVLAFDRDAAGKGAAKLAAAELSSLGFPVYVAAWPDEYKGIDDALLAGATLTYKLATGFGLAHLDADLMRLIKAATPAPEYGTLAEARRQNQQTVAQALANLRRGPATGRVTILESTTGTGKSEGAIRALANFARQGWPEVTRLRRKGGSMVRETRPARAAVLVDQRQQVAEWIARLAEVGLEAAPLIGRVQAPASPTYAYAECDRALRVAELASHHHSTDLVCGPKAVDHLCPAMAMHALALGTALPGSEPVEPANIVVATKDALLHGGLRLEGFDILIIDEGVERHFYSVERLGDEELTAWLRGMDASSQQDGGRLYPADCPQRQLQNTLYLAAMLANHGQPRGPLLDVLRAVRPDVDGLLEDCAAEQPEPGRHGLPFEQRHIAPTQGGSVEVIPLVLWRDLVAALHEEATNPNLPSVAWCEDGSIAFYHVRDDVVRLLSPDRAGRKLDAVVLDATPGPLLRGLLPAASIVRNQCEQRVTVTQVTDSLYTSRQLKSRKGEAATKLAKLIGVLAAGDDKAKRTAVLGPKSLVEAGGGVATELDDALGLEVGWFGRDDRAHNRWRGVERLVVVGHHQLPPDEVAARAAMLRRYLHEPSKVEEQNDGDWRVLRPYLYEAPDGSGYGYWQRAYTDPLAQAIALHSEQATIQQAIGRVRGALAEPGVPIEVVLLTATPVADLEIDQLTTVDALLDEGGITPPPRRISAELARLNAEREQAAQARLNEAWASGVRGVLKLARAAASHNQTAAAFLAAKASVEGSTQSDRIYVAVLSDTPDTQATDGDVLVATWQPVADAPSTSAPSVAPAEYPLRL